MEIDVFFAPQVEQVRDQIFSVLDTLVESWMLQAEFLKGQRSPTDRDLLEPNLRMVSRYDVSRFFCDKFFSVLTPDQKSAILGRFQNEYAPRPGTPLGKALRILGWKIGAGHSG